MRAKNTNKVRQFSSLLNEHWKRKQRLKEPTGVNQPNGSARREKVKQVVFLPSESAKSRAIRELDCFRHLNHRRHSNACEPFSFNRAATIDRCANFSLAFALALIVSLQVAIVWRLAGAQSVPIQSDPRPTIYSGQVSFGLLLSAHSSPGAELATSASHLVSSLWLSPDSLNTSRTTSIARTTVGPADKTTDDDDQNDDELPEEEMGYAESRKQRQIFERNHHQRRQQQQQQQQLLLQQQQAAMNKQSPDTGVCNQINPSALYAGMAAIWASHQANLVGDSHLAIGTYVYDSCNDLDIGQRQSVRIVSNLNAFQQTTCESPRGSPISVTIAHGDNQLRAIQLLTSFRVPVISTKEHFALEDYQLLSGDQRRYLFTTAPSSRYLAVGALRFSRRIVSRSTSSPKLPNQFHKMSSKNGLIVISRNLPARFISFLSETIPNHVNYEMLQSSQPIDQIKSVSALESILTKSSSSSSAADSASESRPSSVYLPIGRTRREPSDSSDSSESGSGSADYDSDSNAGENTKMLSPTILMFITPSEAIDLVTRLRNDLAEVSRYFSLIVATREDISPALRTIFHRGGSRLCSGKAFYTISPRSDDISEFSRYFRDTVQMEGESSDHPLICEFAKHQASSKVSSDLDDISAEPVIKAVWTAAAAFKSVHRRECGSQGASQGPATGNLYRAQPQGSAGAPGGSSDAGQEPSQTRSLSSRQSTGAKQSECMVRMNKNMSNLVQRALKKLDVTINSTGLQSLDGFGLKFDHQNELMTNKFSIKYINKECEIAELGLFSGLKDSLLRLDDETLAKSLESTLPDPWPVTPVAPPVVPVVVPVARPSPATNQASTTETTSTAAAAATTSEPGGADPDTTTNRRLKAASSQDVESSSAPDESKSDDDSESAPSDQNEKSPDSGPPPRASKRARTTGEPARKQRKKQQPLTALGLGGRSGLPGITDSPGFAATTTSTIGTPTTSKPYSKPIPFTTRAGVTMHDWLQPPIGKRLVVGPLSSSKKAVQPDDSLLLKAATTEAPVYTTLPESGGNADLDELPPKPSTRSVKSPAKQLEAAASTQGVQAADYVTAHYLTKNLYSQPAELANSTPTPMSRQTDPMMRLGMLRDLEVTPAPLSTSSPSYTIPEVAQKLRLASSEQSPQQTKASQGRTKLRWIHGNWFALAILGANICGALLTLYVLTFLLMKNCDGSLDRDNQGIRSIHLLAIIVVFFGSTLFIVYPTPGLCLLRSSWHNFGLVMLFGSLLLHSMQIRSLNTLGLGGRPNKLNQILTLLFMVGVQVSFELQRWKYESANYLNFVQQYFGATGNNDDKKLIMLNNAIADQFNPLNSFNDQLTPVSIQVSEQYQNLLHDYCLQQTDDFIQSQIYICMLVGLLTLFSAGARRQASSSAHHHTNKLTTSGKLVASQHEANLDLTPNQFQFAPNGANKSLESSSMFLVSLLSAPIYSVSVVLHVWGQNWVNQDLISSVTLVLLAFVALVGIFLPILMRIHRYGDLVSDRLPGTLSRPVINSSQQANNLLAQQMGLQQAATFAMFPEFTPTGLRRPPSSSGASAGERSSSSGGGGSRRPFAETKESRRKMGAALANLGPTADSLRNLGFYGNQKQDKSLLVDQQMDPATLNLKLNLTSAIADDTELSDTQTAASRANRGSGGEKRLIMLDVDPCCPRHGISACQNHSNTPKSYKHHHHHHQPETSVSSKSSRLSYSHQ